MSLAFLGPVKVVYHTYPRSGCHPSHRWMVRKGVWRVMRPGDRQIVKELVADQKPFRLRVDVTPPQIEVPATA
jgi:hypothetical protein